MNTTTAVNKAEICNFNFSLILCSLPEQLLPSKNIQNENTPRKIPFKDATNSSAFKTPGVNMKNGSSKIKESTTQMSKLSEAARDELVLGDDFHPSSHGGCFCDGAKKKCECYCMSLEVDQFLKCLSFS